jgi:hypothetical protein
MPHPMQVGLVVRSDRYDDDHQRWREEVEDLLDALRIETDALERRRTPVPGTKGTAEALVLALGSAGVFEATVHILRAWLARDRDRAVELTFTDGDGTTRTVRASAENAGRDVFAPLAAAAASLARDTR